MNRREALIAMARGEWVTHPKFDPKVTLYINEAGVVGIKNDNGRTCYSVVLDYKDGYEIHKDWTIKPIEDEG